MKTNITDMTQGSPTRHLLLFALPAMIGNIFQQVYNLADSVIVGRFVGADAFAAVGATASIPFLFFALCNGIGSGGGIVVSQFYGAQDESNVKKCIVNTGLIMLIVPLFFAIVGFALTPALLRLLNTPAELMQGAVSYTRILCAGLLFVSLYNFISSMMRALGDSKTPLYFLIASTIINIILDTILVVIFHMGINGAALATVISQLLSVIGCMLYAIKTNPYFRFSREDYVFTWDMCYKVVRLGVPLSLQFALIAISSMAVQKIVNAYGTIAVAAFTATNRIEQLIHQPYGTLSLSLSTFTGQNYGAKRYDRVVKGYRKGLLIMVILTGILTLMIQLGATTLVSLFVTETSVIEMGAMGLRITSLFYLALGMINVVRGLLNGLGDAFFALFNGVIEVIGRFTIPLLMTSYMGLAEPGIWISCGVVWVLSGGTAWIRYITYTKELRKNAAAM
ncbi:MAG: MATE family efflux transporter [Lachnospiraceae bacterium]|nr:MATE family efflux transporter [Lachnospiraceae bacterium]